VLRRISSFPSTPASPRSSSFRPKGEPRSRRRRASGRRRARQPVRPRARPARTARGTPHPPPRGNTSPPPPRRRSGQRRCTPRSRPPRRGRPLGGTKRPGRRGRRGAAGARPRRGTGSPAEGPPSKHTALRLAPSRGHARRTPPTGNRPRDHLGARKDHEPFPVPGLPVRPRSRRHRALRPRVEPPHRLDGVPVQQDRAGSGWAGLYTSTIPAHREIPRVGRRWKAGVTEGDEARRERVDVERVPRGYRGDRGDECLGGERLLRRRGDRGDDHGRGPERSRCSARIRSWTEGRCGGTDSYGIASMEGNGRTVSGPR